MRSTPATRANSGTNTCVRARREITGISLTFAPGKDAASGVPVGAGGPSLLAAHRAIVDRLFSESGASSWNFPRERFDVALERSANKQFASTAPRPGQLEEYLGALHLQDLALATRQALQHGFVVASSLVREALQRPRGDLATQDRLATQHPPNEGVVAMSGR